MTQPTAQTSKTGNPLGVAIAWLLVGVPLAWGVSQTFLKSLALFH